MEQIQFNELVAEMRKAQKEYFRTRSKEALTKSIRLERSVDLFLNKGESDNLCKCDPPSTILFDGQGICEACKQPKI